MKNLIALLQRFHKSRKKDWKKEEVVGMILKFMQYEMEGEQDDKPIS